MEQTRIFKALGGVRGRAPVDLDGLASLLVRFGDLVVEQRWIREIDINPLLVSPEGLVALDARVVLHDPQTSPEALPRLAIRPYPSQYEARWRMNNGVEITIRPIRPDDEQRMILLHQGLGTELFRRLIAVARDEKLARVVSTILTENREMRGICQKLGFRLHSEMEDDTVRAELQI